MGLDGIGEIGDRGSEEQSAGYMEQVLQWDLLHG